MKSEEALRYKALSPYAKSGSLTREHFLFRETRLVGELYLQGLADAEIVEKVYKENLFQYPTEKSLRKLAQCCLKRLHALGDERLRAALVQQPASSARQICLYAMMQQNRLMHDFMLKVIGKKFSERDYSFNRLAVSSFLLDLQEQDPWVASWSASTLTKIRQVMVKTLVDNEYLDNNKAERLNTVMLNDVLETVLREKNPAALAAFNCLY